MQAADDGWVCGRRMRDDKSMARGRRKDDEERTNGWKERMDDEWMNATTSDIEHQMSDTSSGHAHPSRIAHLSHGNSSSRKPYSSAAHRGTTRPYEPCFDIPTSSPTTPKPQAQVIHRLADSRDMGNA
ncbi:hypothetical protein EX30DRAFT_350018 [Ascodesmis nigricans]|uniref:Uncharacterized protein n=1 Tax=Ascodesmis nigricans TaxID=341454 RepID=A0A4S2MTK7_9PEZI|nr:hypothetical protein EX30DRAFT_350018 [Ascodesmis nigricans]